MMVTEAEMEAWLLDMAALASCDAVAVREAAKRAQEATDG